MDLGQESTGCDGRWQDNARPIDEERESTARPAQGPRGRTTHVRCPFQLRQSLVDQIEADVVHAFVGGLAHGALLSKQDCLTRDRAFNQRTVFRDLLHRAAVVVARGEFHPAVNSGGILAQDLLDRAQALHEIAPVGRPQDAQAADAVADGNLIGRLLLILTMDHLLDGQIGLGKALSDPSERQGEA